MKSYTYKIYDRADSEIFAQLKKDIVQMYPEFSEKRESKEGDGSLTAFFTCDRTGESIAAELSYANGNIVVTSDIPMEELSKKYFTKPKAESCDTGLIDLHSINLFTPMGIKLIIVPSAILILSIAANILLNGSLYGYFDDLLYVLEIMAVGMWKICGVLMFIPAALLSLWLAENKRSDAYKLPLAAFLVFVELHAMVFYFYDFYDYAGITYVALYLFGGAMLLVSQLPTVYILLLPLIITDEIAAVKHEAVYGKRMSFWQSASYWICTAVVMLAVCIGFFMIGSSDKHDDYFYFDEPESRYQYTDEVIPPLLAEYGSHMRTVADYAVSHNYYDWYCCPDESVKESWQALFEDSGRYIFDYELTDRSSCDFRIYVNGGNGEGFWTVGFDDEYIYVNGTIYDTFEEV